MKRFSSSYLDYEKDNYKLIKDFYKNSSSCAAIDYSLKTVHVKEEIDIWLRVVVEECLYVGLCVTKNNADKGWLLTDSEVKQYLPKIDFSKMGKNRHGGSWVYWEFLPTDNNKDSPNFKVSNEQFYDLFDDEKFKTFIENCVVSINKFMDCYF